MKLLEKIAKLETAVSHLRHLDSLCPDIEVVKANTSDYYCSKFITHNAENVEFLTPQNTFNAIHKACLYQDYSIMDSVYRVYGIPFEIKVLLVPDKGDEFHCYDYTALLEKEEINPVALRKMHLYVIEFMKNNNIPVNKRTLPDNIKNLLSFI